MKIRKIVINAFLATTSSLFVACSPANNELTNSNSFTASSYIDNSKSFASSGNIESSNSFSSIESSVETSVSFSASSVSANSSQAVGYEENQSLFNRMISDYYEQRILNPKIQGNNMYLVYPVSSSYYQNVALTEIPLNFILSKTSSGAYVLGIDNYMTTFGEMYYYAFDDVYISNQVRMPDVWYKGRIYYLTDAYYRGIINTNELVGCINKMKTLKIADELIVSETDSVRFDPSVETLNIENIDEDNASTLFKIKNDFYDKVILKNNFFKDYDVNLNDIHIYQSFAHVNDVICANFSIDGIDFPKYLFNAPSKEWKFDLNIGGTTVKPFQNIMPIVWVNRNFYPIDEAFSSGLINKNTTIELLRQYVISAKQVNGSFYQW